MINKKSIIILIIIFFLAVIIFIGYYPPFFPFLKYGPFSKPITKEVFSINNFPYSPDDPQFLVEVKKIVKERWYDDARLAWIDATLLPDGSLSYGTVWGMFFYSDSHPIGFRYIEKEKVLSELKVAYNAETYIGSHYIRSLSMVLPEPVRDFLDREFNFSFYEPNIRAKIHIYRPVGNKKLTALTCIDNFSCRSAIYNFPGNINLEDIKILPKQAYEMVADSVSVTPEMPLYIILVNSKETDWFREKGLDPEFPFFWRISSFRINATTGEIFER